MKKFEAIKRAIALILVLTFAVLCVPTMTFGAVAETATEKPKKDVNVVFAIDTTGSMDDEIANVKNNLSTFVAEFSKVTNINLRMALIEYRDIEEDGIDSTKVYKNSAGSPWFEDETEMKNKIATLRAKGGGDAPETAFDALGYLVCGSDYTDAIPFNSKGYKFAFVLTDDEVKTNNRFGITGMSNMISRLKANGIYTSVVSPSSYKSYYKSLYSYIPAGGTESGIWMDIYGNFATNMYDYAMYILSIVRPDVLDIDLQLGDTYNFKTIAAAYGLKTATATYTSSNSSVLKMSETTPYLGSALALGKALVTISDGDKTLECNVTVKEKVLDPVKELKISTEVTVGVDQSVYIKAIALPEEAKEKGLNWSVGDSSIIAILDTTENLCHMKGLKSGTTTLSAVTKDGGYAGTATITVTVNPIIPVTGVTISMTACTLAVGERRSATGSVLPNNATNKGGFWYSSNSDIVKIVTSDDSSCTFEAVHCGEAKVYFVSNEGGFSKYITVTVPHVEASEPVVLKSATRKEEGTLAYLCTVCGEVLRTESIPTGAHDFGPWVFVEVHDGALVGYNQRTCRVCGATEKENVYGDAHLYTEEVSGKYGDIIKMKICLEEGAYLNDLQATFYYDNTIFEALLVEFEDTSATVARAVIDAASGKIRFLYSASESISEESLFATVTFRINKKVAFKTVPALWLDEDSYHVAHILFDDETYTIEINVDDDFGLVHIWGKDPNGDGELDIRDLAEILRAILSDDYNPYDSDLVDRCDCNYDGVVDIADITYLQNIIVLFDAD